MFTLSTPAFASYIWIDKDASVRKMAKKDVEAAMRSEPARCCAECRLQIAFYDVSAAYKGSVYHEFCFVMVIREEANRQKPLRAEVGPDHTSRHTSA